MAILVSEVIMYVVAEAKTDQAQSVLHGPYYFFRACVFSYDIAMFCIQLHGRGQGEYFQLLPYVGERALNTYWQVESD